MSRGCSRRIAALLGAVLLLAAGCGGDSSSPPPPDGPPFALSDFSAPETCAGCHPNHYAEWSSSMHAYAFKDPVFFAMNFAELERTNGELGQFCIGCHTPIGTLTGTTPDRPFDPESMPAIVQAGISCDVCHSMTAATPGATEDGVELALDPGDTKYGPLPPFDAGPGVHRGAQNLELFANSGICRACHNLTVRGNGLERTFEEWENSIFASRPDKHCQGCHMPSYAGRAATNGPERPTLHRHWFTGVDVALTDGFPDHEGNVERVRALLADAVTFAVDAPAVVAAGDTAEVRVTVTNDRTGHAIPSGTSFSRQMWVEIVAASEADTLYRSGNLDANGDLRDANSALEPNADPDLMLFTSVLEGGDDVTVFTATGIRESMLQPLAPDDSRTQVYRVPVPAGATAPVAVSARLRFRALPPYKVRAAGLPELVARIPIFDMETADRTIALR